jgi:hypothetical protein
MDTSAYAFTHGVHRTRETLASWRSAPSRVLRRWTVGSLIAALVLLMAIWAIATVSAGTGYATLARPPFAPGGLRDVLAILGKNLLVLALHAMACVAGFIAGSSLPLQARFARGWRQVVHEHGRRVALACVVGATIFSLSWQACLVGLSAGRVAFRLGTSPTWLMLGLLPHALPELVALFLPLAAWVSASRRGEWEQLLAAAAVTVVVAVPVLIVTAVWEVYGAPHLLAAMLGYQLR